MRWQKNHDSTELIKRLVSKTCRRIDKSQAGEEEMLLEKELDYRKFQPSTGNVDIPSQESSEIGRGIKIANRGKADPQMKLRFYWEQLTVNPSGKEGVLVLQQLYHRSKLGLRRDNMLELS